MTPADPERRHDPPDSALVRAAAPRAGRRTPRCGSCARPAARCRSTARCARASRCSTPAADPDLVTEITLQPVRRHGVDAAIFFTDIVVPLAAVGVDLDIVPGVGPVVAEPIRTRADLDRLPRAHARRTSPTSPSRCGCSPRELGRDPAHRLRRRARSPSRRYLVEGGPSQEPRAHQGADVRRPAAVARPVRPARADLRRVPAGAGRGRRLGGAAVRLVGRRAAAGRLRGVRPAALAPRRSRAVADLGRARASTSASAPASCSR